MIIQAIYIPLKKLKRNNEIVYKINEYQQKDISLIEEEIDDQYYKDVTMKSYSFGYYI